jgi:hypothetical protein
MILIRSLKELCCHVGRIAWRFLANCIDFIPLTACALCHPPLVASGDGSLICPKCGRRYTNSIEEGELQ